MGVLDYYFDNDWIQRIDIENLQRSSMALRRNVVRDSGRLRDLEAEIDHLSLINEALMRLLEKKGVLVRDEFRSLLVEVDLEDGVHDGKLARPETPRPPRPDRCTHCGAGNDAGSRYCSGCRRPLFRR